MKPKFICIFILIFAITFGANATTNNNSAFLSEENANINLYEKVTPGIVAIEANIENGQSYGTGFIIDKSGIILTSSHILDGVKTLDITTASGQVYEGKIISKEKDNQDLALIKIEPKEPLTVLKLGNFNNIKVGQKVIAIGNPFGFRGTMTIGIVSRIDYVKNKIQTDAAINPGSSGCPLLNGNGEVIGISQAIYNPDNNQSNIGIGFAIPVNEAEKFILLAKKSKKF